MGKDIRDFLRFEKEKTLFERTYNDVYYWQTLRRELVIDNGEISTDPSMKERKCTDIIALFRDFWADCINCFFLKKCDILYFDKQSVREVDGEEVDPYFGYFGFEKEYHILRCFYSKKQRAKAYRKKGIGIALARVNKQLFQIKFRLFLDAYRDKDEENFLYKLCSEMKADCNLSISAGRIIRKVRRIYVIHKVYENYYRMLLKKMKPQAIFVVCYYNEILFPLYKVAKELSIPVIELQHGINIGVLPYQYLDCSEKGKELPGYYFSYGDFWNSQIQLPDCVQIKTIGNPFLEAMKKRYVVQNAQDNDNTIVFYSQGYEDGGRELEKLAIELFQKGYIVYFKFHPKENPETYTMLNNYKEIHTVKPGMNIYKLFSIAKHHVTIMSTVLYEAMSYDVCRYVYKNGNVSNTFMRPLIESGAAMEFSDAHELESLLGKKQKNSIDTLHFMWNPDAENNGKRALEEIMSYIEERGE